MFKKQTKPDKYNNQKDIQQFKGNKQTGKVEKILHSRSKILIEREKNRQSDV